MDQQPNAYPNPSLNAYPAYPTHPQMPSVPPVGYAHQMRRQSIKVHILLLFTTAGIGNILYAMWARSRTAARYSW